MLNRDELTQRHWQYYRLLEKRFMQTFDYVEPNRKNYPCFSNTYALLIQAIGAELDTMFKVYCGYDLNERTTIESYLKAIDNEEATETIFPFRDQKIELRGYDLIIQPFKDWDQTRPAESLSWWKAFTELKHNRYESREYANFENTLLIIGALFFVEMKAVKKATEMTGEPDVFDEISDLFLLRKWSKKAFRPEAAWDVLAYKIKYGSHAEMENDI